MPGAQNTKWTCEMNMYKHLSFQNFPLQNSNISKTSMPTAGNEPWWAMSPTYLDAKLAVIHVALHVTAACDQPGPPVEPRCLVGWDSRSGQRPWCTNTSPEPGHRRLVDEGWLEMVIILMVIMVVMVKLIMVIMIMVIIMGLTIIILMVKMVICSFSPSSEQASNGYDGYHGYNGYEGSHH